MSQLDDVIKFNQTIGSKISHSDPAILSLRMILCEEETRELAEDGFGMVAEPWTPPFEGGAEVDLVEIADACCDIVYVALGTLHQLFGPECAKELWDEVHRSNMDKFPNGVVQRNQYGKVVKPEGWREPDLASILRKFGIAV